MLRSSTRDISGHEVVVIKQPTIAVPPLCAGCGGRVEALAVVQARRLRLTIGLCGSCDVAQRQLKRGATLLFQLTMAGGLLAIITVVAAAPLPELVVVCAPALAVLLCAALIWSRLRSGLAATGPGSTTTPYRSGMGQDITPPTPVAISRIGKTEALVFCANGSWAEEFARANGFEARRPTRRPGLKNGLETLAGALTLAGVAGIGLWTYEFPEVLIDNGSSTDIVVWMDGVPQWRLGARRRTRPLSVHVTRAPHRFGYQVSGASAPSGEVDAKLPDWLTWLKSQQGTAVRPIYNPGAFSCYLLYEVAYGPASTPPTLRREHLPQAEWMLGEADFFFESPPKEVDSRGSKTRSVIERDDLCGRLRRARCPSDVIADEKACFVRAWDAPSEENCAKQAIAACRARAATQPGGERGTSDDAGAQ